MPRIIHQTWKTCDLPDHWKESLEQYIILHPHWSFHFTTDEENLQFVKTYFKSFLSTYEMLPFGIQRADCIRYMYLYAYGGLYSDLDIVPVRKIDEYFDMLKASGEGKKLDLYVSYSSNVRNVFTNSFIIARPGCQFFLRLLDNIKQYRRWPFTPKHFEVMYSTGPLAFTKILKEYKDFYILPSQKFIHLSTAEIDEVNCKEEALVNGSFVYPIEGNSWHDTDSSVVWYAGKFFRLKVLTMVLIVLVWIRYALVKRANKKKLFKTVEKLLYPGPQE